MLQCSSLDFRTSQAEYDLEYSYPLYVGHRKICESPASHLRVHLRSFASHLRAACVTCEYLLLASYLRYLYKTVSLRPRNSLSTPYCLIPLFVTLFRPGGHRKICVPPAVTCEHWLRASCELKKIICGHLRAERVGCAQLDVGYVSICEHLRAFAYLLRCLIQCVAMYLIFWELINFDLPLGAETIFIQKRYDWE
jgi:hypothetical protein